MKKRILLTGSNGLLGQKLVGLLTQKPDVDLVATARGENRLPYADGYTYQPMDITDRQQVMDVVCSTRPDIVIHTAAMTDVDKCELQKDDC
ncbi:MAG: NAD-dependent epimerase/dehydratase family protein, partial [Oxalobacteraceae bacterium]